MLRTFIASLLLAAGLAGCAFLGIQEPEDTSQRLVAAEASFTAAVESATAAYKAGYIEPGSSVEKAVDAAIEAGSSALDVAQDLYRDGQPGSAEEWIGFVFGYADEIKNLVAKARAAVSSLPTHEMEIAA